MKDKQTNEQNNLFIVSPMKVKKKEEEIESEGKGQRV